MRKGLKRYPLRTSGLDGVMTGGSVAGLLAGTILPGSTWNFQVWHRDDDSVCGARSNLSNAIAVTFGP